MTSKIARDAARDTDKTLNDELREMATDIADGAAIAGSLFDAILPSLFDSMRVETICKCKFCLCMWLEIDEERMTDAAWYAYAGHLEKCHGWMEGDIEA